MLKSRVSASYWSDMTLFTPETFESSAPVVELAQACYAFDPEDAIVPLSMHVDVRVDGDWAIEPMSVFLTEAQLWTTEARDAAAFDIAQGIIVLEQKGMEMWMSFIAMRRQAQKVRVVPFLKAYYGATMALTREPPVCHELDNLLSFDYPNGARGLMSHKFLLLCKALGVQDEAITTSRGVVFSLWETAWYTIHCGQK